MTQIITIVNACLLVPDSVVAATIPAFQTHVDRDFMPRWQKKVKGPFQLKFIPASTIYSVQPDRWPIDAKSWPIFLNKHPGVDGALGWHTDDVTQDFPIHGRINVGDCMRFGLKWSVTLCHELDEVIADPLATRVYRMANGDLAAYEPDDAVESDDQSYDIDGVAMSNFVYPDYFSRKRRVQYDFQGKLKAPCPALTPGGYMSIYKRGEGWTDIQAMKEDDIASRRAILHAQSWRHLLRNTSSLIEEIEEV